MVEEQKQTETANTFPCPMSPNGQHEFRESQVLSDPVHIHYYCVYCLARTMWDRAEEEAQKRVEKLLTSRK